LESISDPDGVHAFVGGGEIRIRNVIEHYGKAVALSERNSDFDGDSEQHSRSKLFPVGVIGVEVAVMNGETHSGVGKKDRADPEFP
jgi:hypothetical protein